MSDSVHARALPSYCAGCALSGLPGASFGTAAPAGVLENGIFPGSGVALPPVPGFWCVSAWFAELSTDVGVTGFFMGSFADIPACAESRSRDEGNSNTWGCGALPRKVSWNEARFCVASQPNAAAFRKGVFWACSKNSPAATLRLCDSEQRPLISTKRAL